VLWGGTSFVPDDLHIPAPAQGARVALIMLVGAAAVGYLLIRPLPERRVDDDPTQPPGPPG
jgi:hypothetical protein